jgi:hypothetical protein
VTFQDRSGPFRTVQDRSGPFMTVQDRSGPFRTVQDRSGPFRTVQDRSGPFRTVQERTSSQDQDLVYNIDVQIFTPDPVRTASCRVPPGSSSYFNSTTSDQIP